jgi:hypothetical protein
MSADPVSTMRIAVSQLLWLIAWWVMPAEHIIPADCWGVIIHDR